MSPPKSSSTTSLLPAKGTYVARKPTNVRSPCPAVNTLAHHGYIPRSGRGVRASELHAAMGELGAFGNFAMRRPGKVDDQGVAVLDLDQLARPNVVEHDISLSRFDHDQGDKLTPHPELIKDILAASSNGETLNVPDFVKLRKARIEGQREVNPKVHYVAFQNQIACTEIALVLKVFGDGTEVPLSYVKALFEEERLPREEGWKKMVWWSLGLMELNSLTSKFKALVRNF